jgi:hypothetical protein
MMATKAKARSAGSAQKPAGKMSSEEVTGLIRKKAQELWEKKGRVQGKDLEIWLEAERAVCKGIN